MTGGGKIAIVTGASTGIGRGIAITLAKKGWRVAFTYLNNKDAAAETEAALKALNGFFFSRQCDVGFKDQVAAFFDEIAERGAVPDLLVNNAGVQTWSSLLDLKEEDWERVIRTNLSGAFFNTKRAARMMIDAGKGGSIVNIGSGCNKVAFPKLVDYTASKGGLEQFTKVAAVELGAYKIRVNCVAPGAIAIERTAAESDDYSASWAPITPLGRVGDASDVADVVAFLASDDARYVTGQTIWVDGGVFTRAPWPYR